MTDSFSSTLTALEGSADHPERFSSSFREVLPVSGASVSTLGTLLGSETVSATDDLAARLDELQFDLGEGPCWDAIRQADSVLEPDFPGRGPARWPALVAAVEQDRVASIFAFPLVVGELRVGAVDLYSSSPLTLDSRQSEQATAMADVVGRHILREALAFADDHQAAVKPHSRRIVHQATGFLLAQVDIDVDDALLMLQAHAFTSGRSVMAVSEDILTGRLRFVRNRGRIEALT